MPSLLEDIAIPRRHGTEGADVVEARVRTVLEQSGHVVEDRPFAFSDWPGRWGVTTLGLLLGTDLLLGYGLVETGHFTSATLLLLLPILATILYATHAARVILDCPWCRRRGNNLFAWRPGAGTRILVVAHRDSKSQGAPLVVRVGGAAALILAWTSLFVQAMIGRGTTAAPVQFVTLVLVLAGSVALAVCVVGNESPGALDNASGLLALLEIASNANAADDIAFLVTDAEEYALAGSRAIADRVGRVDVVINLDGLDESGPLVVIEGTKPWKPSEPGPFTVALASAAKTKGLSLRRRGLPPGLLVDHVAFAEAGVPALTIMRGHLRSMARVHTRADNLTRLRGRGAIEVAAIVSDAIERYRSTR
jgi:Peptidase family M28